MDALATDANEFELVELDETDGEMLDSDLDGELDTLAVDADGDDYAESAHWDSNGDGLSDVISVDSDGDGWADLAAIDGDLDGVVDTVTADLDGDGMIDATSTDLDGDGVLETHTADTDGDGVTDWFGTDTDADGVIDDESTETDPFSADGGVHGSDESAWYQAQSESGECVPTSVAMLVSEHTGEWLPYEDAVDTASDLGLLPGEPGSWGGMWAQQAVELLDHYGVDAHVEHGTLDVLADHLDDGHGVIALVDANELWGMPDSPSMNHALVVTEIDEEAGTVTLNDPGQPDGEGFEVPIDEFMDAWSDGGNQMVVTDDPAPGHEPPAGPFDSTDPRHDELILGDMAVLDTTESLILGDMAVLDGGADEPQTLVLLGTAS